MTRGTRRDRKRRKRKEGKRLRGNRSVFTILRLKRNKFIEIMKEDYDKIEADKQTRS